MGYYLENEGLRMLTLGTSVAQLMGVAKLFHTADK